MEYDSRKDAGVRVRFRDSHGAFHNALVTCTHGPTLGENAINLLYVSNDPTKDDQYGRQIERATSVPVKGPHAAPGGYYYELEA